MTKNCPLCGGERTHFGDSYSDGEEWVERAWENQECSRRSCELPCRLWEQVASLVEQARVSAALLAACRRVAMADEIQDVFDDVLAAIAQAEAAGGET